MPDQEANPLGREFLVSAATYVTAAYIAGWAFKFGYLSAFDATWLMRALPPSSFILDSIAPLLAIGFLLLFDVEKVLQAFRPSALMTPGPATEPMTRSERIHVFFSIFLAVFMAAFATIASKTLYVINVLSFIVALVIAAGFFGRAIATSTPRRPRLASAIAFCIIAIGAFPVLLGRAYGIFDAGERDSRLPVLRLSVKAPAPCDNNAHPLRLLLATEGRVYGVCLTAKKTTVAPVEWPMVQRVDSAFDGGGAAEPRP